MIRATTEKLVEELRQMQSQRDSALKEKRDLEQYVENLQTRMDDLRADARDHARRSGELERELEMYKRFISGLGFNVPNHRED